MNHRFTLPGLCTAVAFCALAAHTAGATVIYNPGQGVPGAQGWLTAGSGSGSGSQAVVNGLLAFDSTGSSDAYGNGRFFPGALDTSAGFLLSWQLQLKSEEHTSDNRAGFSLLLQGQDQTKSLELGFWTDKVWALKYEAGGADSGYLRDAAATASFDTQSALHTYTLTVLNDQFSLEADNTLLFGGALRDYPTIGLSTLPYLAQSFIFFGDDSSRGKSTANIGAIQLLPLQAVPEPSVALLVAASLVGLALTRRTQRSAA
jgi:hypothetical protein